MRLVATTLTLTLTLAAVAVTPARTSDPQAIDPFIRALTERAPVATLPPLARRYGDLNAPYRGYEQARVSADTTPIFHAVEHVNAPGYRWLLAHGADPRRLGRNGQTLLHAAASAESPEIVRDLLRRGFSARTRDRHGRTPMDLATLAPDTPWGEANGASALLLMRSGARPTVAEWTRTLWLATREATYRSMNDPTPEHDRALAVVRGLLGIGRPERRYDVDRVAEFSADSRKDPRWPLLEAAARGDTALLAVLLPRSARAKTPAGRLELMNAASRNGNGDLVRTLRRRGFPAPTVAPFYPR